MIEGISGTGLIAAAFGPGVARRVWSPVGPAYARDPAGLSPVEQTGYPEPQDRVDISAIGDRVSDSQDPRVQAGSQTAASDAAGAESAIPGRTQLTPEEQQEVEGLKRRDREVRRHEQAHIAAGGQYVRGGAHFEYETGPDGQQYAVDGEVSIDVSEVSGDPAATIRKMQVVRRAALAPAKPSAQDRAIAAKAQVTENKARTQLRQQRIEQQEGGDGLEGRAAAGHGIPSARQSPPRLSLSRQPAQVSSRAASNRRTASPGVTGARLDLVG